MAKPTPPQTYAVILPAAVDEPARLEPWPAPRAVLTSVYRWIGVDCIDLARVPASPQLGFGDHFTLWVDDDGLLVDEPAINPRAVHFAHAHGYLCAALAGDIVVSGGVNAAGDSLGLPRRVADALLADIARISEHMLAAPRTLAAYVADLAGRVDTAPQVTSVASLEELLDMLGGESRG